MAVARSLVTVALLSAALAGRAQAGDPTCTPLTLVVGQGTPWPVSGSVERVSAGGAGWQVEACFQSGWYFCDAVVGADGFVAPASIEFFYPNQFLQSGDSLSDGRVVLLVSSEFSQQDVWLHEPGAYDWSLGLVAGGAVGAPELPGAAWTEIRGIQLHEPDQLVVHGVVSGDLDVLVRYTILGPEAVEAAAVLLQEGDLVEGRTVLAVGGSTDRTWSANAAGQVIASVLLDVPGGTPEPALVVDGAIVAENGVGVPFLPGEVWDVSLDDEVDLGAQGDWVAQTALAAGDELVLHDGALLARTGGPVPGVPGQLLTDVEGARVSDDGRVVFYGAYHSFYRALFVDGAPRVQSNGGLPGGTTLDGGDVLAWIEPDAAFWDITDDGRSLAFLADPLTASWGVYTAPTDGFVALGGALAGTGGLEPSLVGTGLLAGGDPLALTLDDALPDAPLHLVIGFSELAVPFKGGLLVPQPDLIVSGPTTDGDGSWRLAGSWPTGLPACVPFWIQVWVQDPGGPAGFSASNGLRAQSS